MELLADRIAGFFIQSGVATEETRDIYVYGLIHAFSVIIGLVITTTLGFVFSVPLEMLLFFVPFTALRMTSGGYHALTFWRCIIISFLVMFTVAFVLRANIAPLYSTVIISVSIISVIVIYCIAPVGDKRHPLTSAEVLRFKKCARVVVTGNALIALIILALGSSRYSFSLSIGAGASTSSTLVAFLNNKIFGGRET